MAGGTRAQTKKAGAQCGAKKRGGGKCTLAAGWGTNHAGTGRCKLHGGCVPNHVKAAATEEYRKLLGNPIEINPLDALLWMIKIRAGEVKWLTMRMEDLEQKDWVEETLVGKQFHLFARERQHAMADVARFSQMAISLGIAERHVKLMETYAEVIATFIQGMLKDFMPYLNEEGKAHAPEIVRRHLVVLEGGFEPDQAALPPGEAEKIA